MSSLKIARWALLGCVGFSVFAACGGRGNLSPGEMTAGEPGVGDFGGTTTGGTTTGGTAAGGSGAIAGSAPIGGSLPVAGSAPAGGSSVGGSAPIGGTGVGGTGGVCTPGQSLCNGSNVLRCDARGMSYTIAPCPMGTSCVESRSSASCVKQVCTPNQRFCAASGVRACSADGTTSTAVRNCSAMQYCDPMTLSCKAGVCMPNQPACNGTIATTCNANGSGYVAVGNDCAVFGRTCSQGKCLCAEGLADCDGLTQNGCEAKILSDPDNCGSCGGACSSNHVQNRGCDGDCTGSCQAGFADCNGDLRTDGCETATSKDVKNCGACNVACSTNHVTASCSAGTCSGTCAANFADCNGNKQADGCESDSRTDSKNCGACGVVCSTNHVSGACSAGKCAGDCASGFADCNGNKQTDGCEVNTNTDSTNCGACGKICDKGQGCSQGKCVALYTFSGVAKNVPISSLVGWTQCFSEPYGSSSTSIASLKQACTGSLLMMACRPKGSSTLQVAAYAPATDVMFDTGTSNTPHNANGVGWYFYGSESWGFAPEGDPVERITCDVQDSSIGATGVDGDKRVCWHTTSSVLQGGWRCGKNDSLNNSGEFERLLFTAQ